MNRFACILLSCASLAWAQFGRGGDWSTSGYDAQRSNWLRSDAKISPETLQKGGFEFLWKMKLENTPRGLNSLTPPMLMDRLIGYKGFRSLGFIGGSGDKVFTVDTDLARMEWQKSLTSNASPSSTSSKCPGGLTATLARPTSFAMATGAGGRGGGGRGTPAVSAVGQPEEGSVVLAQIAARAAAAAAARANAPAPGRGPGPPPGGGGGFGRGASGIYAISSDGMLHELNVSNGADMRPPMMFLPPNANADHLTVVDNMVYASTSQDCGGAANGVWALDMGTKQVASWKGSANVSGPAFGPDGTPYVTNGSELVALDPKTLEPKSTYKAGIALTSPPVLFDFKGKLLVAVSSSDGRIHLMEASNLATAISKSAALNVAAGSMATWQDARGSHWLLAPAAKAVVALKVVEQGGAPAVEPGWVSRDLTSPLTPVVISGVVFAVSSGEFVTPDTKMSAQQRAQRSTPAVLYALDGTSGKELWSSGKTITSFATRGGLSGGGSQVYLTTYDSTLYAFGFPIEH